MSEREYLHIRAAEEFERAVQAADKKTAALHAALASEFARRCEQGRNAKRS